MSDPPRLRSLLLTRNFPPLVGGMERLNQHVFEALAEAGETALVGPTGCAFHASGAVQIVEVRSRPLVRFLPAAMMAALRTVFRVRPQLVVAGSGLTAPHAWFAARSVGARYAVYAHGLDLVVRHWFYQAVWLRAIRAADVVVVNSRHTAALATAKGVPIERIRVVNPGTMIPPAHDADPQVIRKTLGFGSGPLLLSVGRLTERKGLVPFVREVLPVLVAHYPTIEFLVVGQDAVDALHGRGGSERMRIENAADEAGVRSHVRMLGHVDDEALERVFQCADLHVFPVRDLAGDVEGFGMVALEAAARGVPTVGYAVGGVPDAVDQGVSGELVPAGDATALAQAIGRWLARPRRNVAAQCRAFAEHLSWPEFGRRLRDALA